MANNTKATPEEEEAREKGPTPDAPLSDAAVTKVIKQATRRGYVTYEQLNAVMPSKEVRSEQIEDILAMLNEMGISVVDGGWRERQQSAIAPITCGSPRREGGRHLFAGGHDLPIPRPNMHRPDQGDGRSCSAASL
jgi:RNA polymerase primary sigma factor